MDHWIIWELMALQKLHEADHSGILPIEELRTRRLGLRQRLAALLVRAGVRLDAEASRAVLSLVRNHS